MGERRYCAIILNRDTGWKWVVSPTYKYSVTLKSCWSVSVGNSEASTVWAITLITTAYICRCGRLHITVSTQHTNGHCPQNKGIAMTSYSITVTQNRSVNIGLNGRESSPSKKQKACLLPRPDRLGSNPTFYPMRNEGRAQRFTEAESSTT
jgi:hypothetical protein